MTRVRVATCARAGLLAIWEHVAADNAGAADRLLARIEAAVGAIAVMPGIGHARTDLADDRHRFWACGAYLVVYRADRRGVAIIRVLHAGRDIASLLGEEE